MRNTDDPNPPLIRPLGERVTPTLPSSPPTWKPRLNEHGKPSGIEEGPDGRLRTNIPGNEAPKPLHP